ncbi:hypothetical protein AB0F18_35775 [Streptomyces sp. NPDC029216]|uniref:hypothetical protein n=1 Tax=Streptomyces sp. NPDC029216 TaxID=3154701 RepID=UPI0033E69B89
MTLREGQRVKLATDIGLAEAIAQPAGAVVGFLSLAAGTGGTVERVDGQPPSHGVREYQRLKALLDDYGHAMPEASRKRLEDEVEALQPEWTAFQTEGSRVTARIRFDNGFVLDGAPEDVLTPA